jgi:glycerophosphoryl diester phosphodiesterase
MLNPYTALMSAARAHALAHGAHLPALSPLDDSLRHIDLPALRALGVRVVPWTTNDPGRMRDVIALGVDGLITDRPDLLAAVAAPAGFDRQGHRGARGLRPENTLPAFECGLDHLVTTLETDTGVTRDLRSILWHDQFVHAERFRRLDGAAYNGTVFFRDISLAELQSTYVCDRLHPRFPAQQNDLALSPVAVAFAAREGLPHPYSPLATAQLFRFANFYAEFYATGAGQTHPDAAPRAANAARVHFNLETKILPDATNRTVDPQTFVDALCGEIVRAGLQARCDVQSFDFRTLQLVEEQYPEIATYYLTEEPESLGSELIPASLRQDKTTGDSYGLHG